ncbi:MAG: DUF86 domain-containing protein [Actinobacteria bacterium]|nr:DUF86 domain-containing protein [Actinomycetota bacterium]MBU4449929.1 DUF86 domain-containing protein [Actinomycetota bacterium]MCG2788781.1 DUF86 domain-containing protein [Actinomycetes bacterium]MCG2790806.1 DUF86 domain-containing protein [Actinomycetes bacterium]
MVDKFLVTKKINELKNNLKILHDLKRMPFVKISESLKEQWAVFYGLQISIQIVIDIGNHILASIGENQIEDYADIIDKLGKLEIIPADFAKKIKGMPGLRNILVHEYGIIDIKKIYDILQNNLGDFEDFIFYIKKYIEKE